VDLRSIPKPYLVVNDAAEVIRFVDGEQSAKPARTIHVVPMQIREQPAEEVNLKSGNFHTPGDTRHPHQVRLPATSSASIQNLRSARAERNELLAMQREVDRHPAG
jgi:hypothetical protein